MTVKIEWIQLYSLGVMHWKAEYNNAIYRLEVNVFPEHYDGVYVFDDLRFRRLGRARLYDIELEFLRNLWKKYKNAAVLRMEDLEPDHQSSLMKITENIIKDISAMKSGEIKVALEIGDDFVITRVKFIDERT